MKANPMKKPLSLCALASAVLVFSASPGPAQSVWTGAGTDANWSTPGNWQGSVSPTSSTATAIQMAGTTNLNVNVDSPFTLTSLIFNPNAGAFTLGGSTISLYSTGPDVTGVENQSNSAITINNAFTMLGSAQFRALAGNLTLNGNINLNTYTVNFKAATGKTLTLNGVISGAASPTFNSGGTIAINGANTYGGSNAIFNATVVVGVSDVLSGGNIVSGAFGTQASTVVLGTAGAATTPILMLGGAYTLTKNLQVASSATNATTATIGGNTAAVSNYTGTLTLGSASAPAASATLAAASGGRVNFTGNIVRATGATGTSDSITKTGAGVVALGGASIGYLGTTAVNAGTLLINGTMASGGGAVSVASGATLGGNGTINRAVNVASGGTLSAGDMDASGATSLAGTLTIVGDLSLASSTLKFDLGTASDLVAVTGNLTLGGTLNLTALSGFGAGTYELFSYTGTLTNNGVSLGTLPSGYTYSLSTSTAGQVDLLVAAVPEPGQNALLLLGGAGLGLLALRARKGRGSLASAPAIR